MMAVSSEYFAFPVASVGNCSVLTWFLQAGDPVPKIQPSSSSASASSAGSAGLGVGLYGLILVGAALAFGVYQYLQIASAEKQ
jgi:hypothetical protein